jgi:hypothetical protein
MVLDIEEVEGEGRSPEPFFVGLGGGVGTWITGVERRAAADEAHKGYCYWSRSQIIRRLGAGHGRSHVSRYGTRIMTHPCHACLSWSARGGQTADLISWDWQLGDGPCMDRERSAEQY